MLKRVFMLKRVLLLLFIPSVLFSQSLDIPYNLNFEEGFEGKMPVAWEMPAKMLKLGYSAKLTSVNPKSGRYSFQMHHETEFKEGQYGSVMQSVDARHYRGKKIRFRAALRAEVFGEGSHANLWVHIRRPGDEIGIIDNMEDNPVVYDNWEYYEIIMDVPMWAEKINFGMLLFGSGDAYIDDASLEIINPQEHLNKLTLEIDEKAADRLAKFAKIYGIVRYFYADPALNNLDWGRFLLNNIEKIIKIENDKNFVEYLQQTFEAIAPAVKISNNKKDTEYIKDEKALDNVALSWLHTGLASNDDKSILNSKIINIYESQRDYNGSATQLVNVEEYKGQKVRLDVQVRTKLTKPGSAAQLLLAAENDDGKPLKNSISTVTESNELWQNYYVETVVPDAANFLRIALMLYGEGTVWFDSLRVTTENGNEINVRNSSFEEGHPKNLIPSWYFPRSSYIAGYYTSISMHKPASGKKCLAIIADTATRIYFAKEGQIYSKNIDGIYFSMPYMLYADSTTVYPPSSGYNFEGTFWPEDFLLNEIDAYSRIAMVIEFWNMIEHFHLYKLDKEEHNMNLTSNVIAAARATPQNFVDILYQTSSATHDSQYRVWRANRKKLYGLPFLWEVVQEKLIITKLHEIADESIKVGDEIVEIEGIPAIEYIDSIAKIYPGSKAYRRYKALAEIRTGDKSEKLNMTIKSSNKTNTYDIQRNVIIADLEPSRPEKIEELDDGIVYIDMSRLMDAELKEVAEELKHAKGIIFDARGFSVISEYMIGLFANVEMRAINWKIPIYTAPDQEIVSYKHILSGIKPITTLIGMDVIFLVDHRTIGYTESIVALAKYYELARVLGAESAGSCSEIVTNQIYGNYFYSMTAAKAELPNNQVITEPIKPDIEYIPSIEDIKNQEMPMIQKAVELLKVSID